MTYDPELSKDMPDDSYASVSAANLLHWAIEKRAAEVLNVENPSEDQEIPEEPHLPEAS